MAQLSSIIEFLDGLLKPDLYSENAYNGIQVGGWKKSIKKVAYAVDAGLSVIEEAVDNEADLLIVHHGLLWGEEQPLTDAYLKKIELLVKNQCSLFAAHLPLDGNLTVGNGAELARFLNLKQIEPFCEYAGATVGVKAKCDPQTIQQIADKLSKIDGAVTPLILPFGVDQIKTVAVVTGSGGFAIKVCAKEGIDLLISGEPKQELYHLTKELKCNAIFAGHYGTETFGVKALARKLEENFKLDTLYINQPTGI